jgi:hypothetical protein
LSDEYNSTDLILSGDSLDTLQAKDFKSQIAKDEPSYGFANIAVKMSGGRKNSVHPHLVFIVYMPDSCLDENVKFAYLTAKKEIKKYCPNVGFEVQIKEFAQINHHFITTQLFSAPKQKM